MAAKIYSGIGPSMVADSGGDVADSIMSWMQQAQANKRADSQLLMQQAQHKWQMDTERRTLNSVNALQTYSGEGYDWEGLAGGNMASIFAKDLPSFNEGFKKYEESQLANGASANMSVFGQARKENNQRYMNVVKGKFNALKQTVQNQYPNYSNEDINRYMNENYNADKVYANYVAAFDVNDPLTGLQYAPVSPETSIFSQIGHAIYKPAMEGPTGTVPGKIGWGSKLGMAASAVAVPTGIYQGAKQYKAASSDYLKQAEKDWGKPKYEKVMDKKTKKMTFKLDKKGNKIFAEGSGNTAEAFKKKYGTTKKAGGGLGKTFKASEAILEKAGTAGYKGTWPAKTATWISQKGKEAVEFGKSLKSPKEAMGKLSWSKVKDIAKGGLPYLAPGVGEAAGEIIIGGETGQNLGRTAGVGVLVNKTGAYGTGKKAGQSFVNYLAKKFPAIAAKAGVMSQLDSPVIPIMDFVAMGWSAYEIYKLYKSWARQATRK